jgi:beta-N-acetylhexosaminidase
MSRQFLSSFLRILAVTLVFLVTVVAPMRVHTQVALAQDPTPSAPTQSPEVMALLERMTVQRRIGQLFVVSFQGNSAAAGSDIADLVSNYFIGGVQLRAANRNFDNTQTEPSVPQQIARLTNELQALAVVSMTGPLPGEVLVPPPTRIAPTGSPTEAITPTITPNLPPPAVPLLIALAQKVEGSGRNEQSEITQGVTQIPSQMAIGATWNPANAQSAGEVFGGELSKLGINVLFGPTLDVVDPPQPNAPGDLGTRVFGGDPFWVGRLGSAFVAGVHRGSQNRVAVVAQNFPGLGASDRDVRDEIPTVQRSIDQLRQIELAPFFAVMRGDVARENTVDGVRVSHIRYRGFQGNIRASTRPVSLDPQAYKALMTLPEMQLWRNSGGVTFSDPLGLRSVRRFYDPLEATFNARRIAQEAFAAGNDMLVLGNFGLTEDWAEQLANIKDTIRFFQARYVEDPNFAARVDESVARILAMKLRMYNGSWDRVNVLVNEDALLELRPQDNVVAGIAKEGITLLSPNVRELANVMPNQPTKDERIVFITDDREARDCADCAPYTIIPRNTLEMLALNIYGPRTTGQVDPDRVSSYTFSDLAAYNAQISALATGTPPTSTEVATPTETPTLEPAQTLASPVTGTRSLAEDIVGAQWIIISLIDTNPDVPTSGELSRFLSQSADTLRDKRVVVFGLGAPYYLDATEISKVTAYYGVYSRTPAFLEGALRALFGEFAPAGDSPVSVPGVNYALLVQTAPDPNQVIPLTTGEVVTDTQSTPEPLVLQIGQRLKLRAGPILDLNGRVVPDGTPVQFVLSYPSEQVEQRQDPISTRDGIVETTIALVRQGELRIRVEAEPALKSYTVVVDTTETTSSIETIRPTVQPTITPFPVSTNVTGPAADATPGVPTIDATSAGNGALTLLRSSMPGFVLTFAGLLLVGVGIFGLLTAERPPLLNASARLRVSIGLWLLGWLAYVLVARGTPGTRWITNAMGWGGSVVAAVIIAIVAAGIVIAVARFNAHTQSED